MKQLKFEDFLPQEYPLIQHNMIYAIIDLVNKDIKEKGLQNAIFETQRIIKVLKQNNPTEVQYELINLYQDIISKLTR
jgi:hypothetical protein